MNNHTAFISYSWDNLEHQQWVLKLVSDLRKKGIDAKADVFETQTNTVHLDTMMVTNIQNNDFTIIIMTPNYARKADTMTGGVGTETRLLLNIIKEKTNKIIPILKTDSQNSGSVPFYLKGFHYFDFSDETEYSSNLEHLLHRLYGVPEIAETPLGTPPDFISRNPSDVYISKTNNSKKKSDLTIPNLKKVTDRDKSLFIKESFIFLKEGLDKQLEVTKKENLNFDYTIEEVTSRKTIYSLYVEGELKHSMKIWIGNSFGQTVGSINLSQGGFMLYESDNSMNEMIFCEADNNKNLKLNMTMNFSNRNDLKEPNEVLVIIWEDLISKIIY